VIWTAWPRLQLRQYEDQQEGIGNGRGKRQRWRRWKRDKWKGERGSWRRIEVATARGQDTTQELLHMKHVRMEIFGLQSNQIVKRRKLRKRRREEEVEEEADERATEEEAAADDKEAEEQASEEEEDEEEDIEEKGNIAKRRKA
jgi:hypothetical protein